MSRYRILALTLCLLAAFAGSPGASPQNDPGTDTNPAPEETVLDVDLPIEALRRLCEQKVAEEAARLDSQIETQLNIIRNNPGGSPVARRAEQSLVDLGVLAVDRLITELASPASPGTVGMASARALAKLVYAPAEGEAPVQEPVWKGIARKKLHEILRTAPIAQKVLALVALERHPDAELIPDLVTMLESGSFEGKRRAARMLGELKATEAIAPLKKLLDDENYQIRKLAVTNLARLQAPGIEQELLSRLNDPSTDVKFAVYDALSLSRSPATRSALLARLDTASSQLDDINPDPIQLQEIEKIIRTLGLLGDPTVVEALRGLLRKTTQIRIEQATENALVAILTQVRTQGIRSMVDSARPLLDSTKTRLQREAIRVARDLQDKGALTQLYGLLENGDQDLVVRAIEAIGSIADPSSRQKLRNMLRPNMSRLIVVEAAYALARIGDYSGMEKVIGPIRQRIRKDSKNGEAMKDLAKAYKRLGKYNDAVSWFRKSLQTKNVYKPTEVKYLLAASYSLLGQTTPAKSYLQQAMSEGYKGNPDQDPDFENLKKAVGPLTPANGFGKSDSTGG